MIAAEGTTDAPRRVDAEQVFAFLVRAGIGAGREPATLVADAVAWARGKNPLLERSDFCVIAIERATGPSGKPRRRRRSRNPERLPETRCCMCRIDSMSDHPSTKAPDLPRLLRIAKNQRGIMLCILAQLAVSAVLYALKPPSIIKKSS